jgi:hypothetical protein
MGLTALTLTSKPALQTRSDSGTYSVILPIPMSPAQVPCHSPGHKTQMGVPGAPRANLSKTGLGGWPTSREILHWGCPISRAFCEKWGFSMFIRH